VPNLAEENSTFVVNSFGYWLPGFNLFKRPDAWRVRIPASIYHIIRTSKDTDVQEENNVDGTSRSK
jgi:hypothetical protein